MSLLQTYLIYRNAGIASKSLQNEGATGYFGEVTESALREYQLVHGLPSTGAYDATTRGHMIGLTT